MRMPRKVIIGKTTYTVGRAGTAKGDSGSFDASEKPQVKVRYGLPSGNAPTVLVHELIHAGEYEYGLNIRDGQVDQVSHIILDLVRNNPQLVAYLIATKGDK